MPLPRSFAAYPNKTRRIMPIRSAKDANFHFAEDRSMAKNAARGQLVFRAVGLFPCSHGKVGAGLARRLFDILTATSPPVVQGTGHKPSFGWSKCTPLTGASLAFLSRGASSVGNGVLPEG